MSDTNAPINAKKYNEAGYPVLEPIPTVPSRAPPSSSQMYETGSVVSYNTTSSRLYPKTKNTGNTGTVHTSVMPDGREIHVVQVPTAPVEKEENTEEFKFKELNYDDIQVNLRLLGKVATDEKLHVSSNGKNIIVDDRMLQFIRRKASGDSRMKTLAFIQHMYEETEKMCNEAVELVTSDENPKENTEKLITIYSLIRMSDEGLNNLIVTYKADKRFIATIQTIKNKFNVYCDKTLKSTIDGFKNSHNFDY
jgi:hypothetical protein